ncbi:50S ribosomal protein L23 [Candidatus Parcubacteria bacterium]|nr:50S ribosomal protein L23 [Candidatus Parcubacteria bacterium]
MAKQNSQLSLAHVLLRPRITEKASRLGEEGNVYTFDVAKGATKSDVARAITATYKVKPLRVNIITILPKKVLVRGIPGTKGGGKKALVFLKKGEKIEFV